MTWPLVLPSLLPLVLAAGSPRSQDLAIVQALLRHWQRPDLDPTTAVERDPQGCVVTLVLDQQGLLFPRLSISYAS